MAFKMALWLFALMFVATIYNVIGAYNAMGAISGVNVQGKFREIGILSGAGTSGAPLPPHKPQTLNRLAAR